MTTKWGIDLGGTKVECAVLDADNLRNVLIRRRLPTEAEKGYPHILSQIQKLVGEVSAELGEKPRYLGLATPGTLDPLTRTMRGCNTVIMNGQPMQEDLTRLLGLPCRVANDANCFALAEALMGAVPALQPDAQVVFGVILGTGVGGGVVVNRHVLSGRQGIAGEWGHNFLDESGGPCYCGKTGCVETIISGPSLQRFYASQSGEAKKLADIYAAYKAGTDPHAAATIERLIEHFAKGMSVIVNALDPDVIVLGGGVSNIEVLYTEGVERLRKYVFNPAPNVQVVQNQLGDSAGVFGAALLDA